MIVGIYQITSLLIEFQNLFKSLESKETTTRKSRTTYTPEHSISTAAISFERLICLTSTMRSSLRLRLQNSIEISPAAKLLKINNDNPVIEKRKRGRPRKMKKTSMPIEESENGLNFLAELASNCLENLSQPFMTAEDRSYFNLQEIGSNKMNVETYLGYLSSFGDFTQDSSKAVSSGKCHHYHKTLTRKEEQEANYETRRSYLQAKMPVVRKMFIQEHWCRGIVVHPLAKAEDKLYNLVRYLICLVNEVFSNEISKVMITDPQYIEPQTFPLIEMRIDEISDKAYGKSLIYNTVLAIYCLDGISFIDYYDRVIRTESKRRTQYNEQWIDDMDFCLLLIHAVFCSNFGFLQKYRPYESVGMFGSLINNHLALYETQKSLKEVVIEHQKKLDQKMRVPFISEEGPHMVEPLNLEEFQQFVSRGKDKKSSTQPDDTNTEEGEELSPPPPPVLPSINSYEHYIVVFPEQTTEKEAWWNKNLPFKTYDQTMMYRSQQLYGSLPTIEDNPVQFVPFGYCYLTRKCLLRKVDDNFLIYVDISELLGCQLPANDFLSPDSTPLASPPQIIKESAVVYCVPDYQ